MNQQIPATCFIFFIIFSVMTFAQNAGKMIITGFKGTDPSDPQIIRLKERIDNHQLGGVILFNRNIKTKHQLQSLIKFLTKDTPIFVAIDHEGGLVNRLTHSSFKLKTPSPQTLCNSSLQVQSDHAIIMSKAMVDLGINMNFGGVVDISPLISPSSICNHDRCYGSKSSKVSRCAAVVSKEHSKHQLLFALKHFPGHGSTETDSHYDLPDITKTHSDYELTPYFQLNDPLTKYQMVMIGHLMHRGIDPKLPASLSKFHIDILIHQVNFDGFIVTDDLNMLALKSISTDKLTLASLAAEAGNHLLLFEYLSFNQIDEISSGLNTKAIHNPQLNRHINNSIQKIDRFLNDS